MTPPGQGFSPEDVQAMALAFDRVCELTGLAEPSEALTARFADTIVLVASSGDRNPETLARSALNVLRQTASLSPQAQKSSCKAVLHTGLTSRRL